MLYCEVEVEEEGKCGGQLVPRPRHPHPLVVPAHQADRPWEGQGSIDSDLMGGGDEVPVLGVEEEGAEGSEAAEEDITDGGVEYEGC